MQQLRKLGPAVFFSLAASTFIGAPLAGTVAGTRATHTAAPAKQDRNAAFEQALADYRSGHPTAAYAAFARLADAGDPEAARIALVLLRYGPKMHGTAWGASQPQIRHWMQLARRPMEPLRAESGD